MVKNNLFRASSNLAMLEIVARKLDELNQDVVYVGGCATALLVNDPLAVDVRTTLDVDCIIDVISLMQYHKFEEKLRKKGFKNASHDNVICRWICDEIILDVMPTDEKIFGFGNRWYKEALQNAVTHEIGSGIKIKSITAPYFIATKIEAFKTRGNNDLLVSHDFEDIITVIAGRKNIVEEIKNANNPLMKHLQKEFEIIKNNDQFERVLPGHLNEGPLSVVMQRVGVVMQRFERIIQG